MPFAVATLDVILKLLYLKRECCNIVMIVSIVFN